MQLKGTFVATAMAVAIAGLAGCGNSSDRPELGQVTGTITLDGEPLRGIAVVFYPENGRPARGKTNDEGKYELTYIRETKGTKLGPNRVEVAPDEEGEEDAEESADGEAPAKPKAGPGAKPKIPARYNTKTELKVDVKPGENVFDFQLKSDGAAK